MSNYVDLLIPPARQGCKAEYEPLEWVKKNCPTYITHDAVQVHGQYYYRFFFGNEKDRVWFALRWA
jgi:hypothetical protein